MMTARGPFFFLFASMAYASTAIAIVANYWVPLAVWVGAWLCITIMESMKRYES